MLTELTVRDGHGAAFVAERTADGQVVVWIAPPGATDGPSVLLNADARRRVEAFLRLGEETT
jgi:hypothetical protein